MSVDVSRLVASIPDVENKIRKSLSGKAHRLAPHIENTAKRDAPWTDQTGDARRSIKCDVVEDKDSITLRLSGNTDYFEYLEFGHNRRFAILGKTMLRYSDRISKKFGEQ